MTTEDIRTAIDVAINNKVLLTYPQLILFVLCSGVAAYFGAYLKQKGSNLASKEDIEVLTEKIESVKNAYAKQLEDYKNELAHRSRLAEVADFFTEWTSPDCNIEKLNGYSMKLSLWLPNELYRELGSCVCYAKGASSPKEILIKARKHILGEKAGDLKPEHIIHFNYKREPT
jgi:hypothetical protein